MPRQTAARDPPPTAIPAVTAMTDAQDAPAGLSLARDRHLFGPGPKRILALDGGGVRGAISVAFLERIEKIIREEQQRTSLAAVEGGAPQAGPAAADRSTAHGG